jgi:hypothetical protein
MYMIQLQDLSGQADQQYPADSPEPRKRGLSAPVAELSRKPVQDVYSLLCRSHVRSSPFLRFTKMVSVRIESFFGKVP